MLIHRDIRPYYACRAEALLESWICGDLARLQSELDRTVNTWWPEKDHRDRYLLELLKVVGHGMRTCPDLYVDRSQNPAIGVYLDLLQYLSAADSSDANDPGGPMSGGLRLVRLRAVNAPLPTD